MKIEQIKYRLYFIIRNKLRQVRSFTYRYSVLSKAKPLTLLPSLDSFLSLKNDKFTFLNLEQQFEDRIDWNYLGHGKLWAYNLNYFEYLHQREMTSDKGLTLIYDFIGSIQSNKEGLEPFPISLRGINWIKFLSYHKINDQKINDSLYAQYKILMDNLEYHILGNHLLENGFSLLFGAYYFQDEIFYEKAKQILLRELKEEILNDGGHFELSPMYHQLMLFRILDCINLVKYNEYKNHALLAVLEDKAKVMLGWINTLTFQNGAIPLFNDSTNNVAPTTKQLNDYARKLDDDFNYSSVKLSDSGYRKFFQSKYELVVDVGNIGPDYIPGHAHSDTFNFEMYIDHKPFIVDTGLSTYEANMRREFERSTQSHNTVVVDGLNQSEVWGGFRVANRAKIIDFNESTNQVEATHDGYKRIDILHTRTFKSNIDEVSIIDKIDSKTDHECVAYLHFHPDIKVSESEGLLITNIAVINFQGNTGIRLDKYKYAPEFNKTYTGQCAVISFNKKLSTKIVIENTIRGKHENN
ncbi:heparinase II/III family protein [Sulfurovum sp. XGS-02]|uniref:alginate lyase family protein n=1 Tax=Sulfurovum sp. XGS-02 TaxID=2925411 RepID=UPI00204B9FAA|nr:alginate lyase family protein [Sulfurovum sp. XGS-02]UPT76864.1 heparinase II/III family protein [Sulfurovum sp. XGS-02]